MPPSRPRPTSLNVSSVALWRAPRPSTPRRATFPLPGTTSSFSKRSMSDTPPVPPLSYWMPDTPSPLAGSLRSPRVPLMSPKSPRNPFLIPPTKPFDSHMMATVRAVPLLPASPLSIFDRAVSPTSPAYQSTILPLLLQSSNLSPTYCGIRTNHKTSATVHGFAALSSDSSIVHGVPQYAISPLSPRFLAPRTPPCPPEIKKRHMSAYETVQEVARKGSVASAMSSTQEKLAMKIKFFQFIALRKWTDMEKESEGDGGAAMKLLGGWKKILDPNTKQKAKVAMLKQKRFKVLRDAVQCA